MGSNLLSSNFFAQGNLNFRRAVYFQFAEGLPYYSDPLRRTGASTESAAELISLILLGCNLFPFFKGFGDFCKEMYPICQEMFPFCQEMFPTKKRTQNLNGYGFEGIYKTVTFLVTFFWLVFLFTTKVFKPYFTGFLGYVLFLMLGSHCQPMFVTFSLDFWQKNG